MRVLSNFFLHVTKGKSALPAQAQLKVFEYDLLAHVGGGKSRKQ